MTVETKGRSELKSYFVKNAIPTEANFAALIDAPLNQADDGVFKLGTEPLSVVAAPGDRKPTLRLYDVYPKQAPSWTISLKPSQTPNDASTVREGFGIVDGEGNTRLFVDRTTGALGVGVNAPQGALDVLVPGAHPTWNRFVVAGSTDWGNGNSHVTIGSGTGGIMLRNPHVSWLAAENRASIRYGLSGGTSGGKFWDVGIRADSKFTFAFHGTDAHRLSLDATGNLVATGKVTAASVDASGTVTAASFATAGTLSSTGLIFETQASAHIERDGALYRTGGQVYLTVDDNFYIRKRTGDWTARFVTTDGSLTVTGKVVASGAYYAGNSDIYFTNTEHDHSGIGNTAGHAAIENAKNYDALMILGRMSNNSRRVKLWDYLQVNGEFEVTGSATTGAFRARGNAGVVNIEGSNHAYIQWYPLGNAAGRKGWIGYGGANTTTMTVQCESGDLALGAAGSVAVGQGATLNAICIGGEKYGDLPYEYETIQLNALHNLRIYFGTNQRFIFQNNGVFAATGAKAFVIDHPLDPQRELVHAAIEGPEAAVYYRGEAKLEGGSCTIRLPAYFEALTRPAGRTVQITPKFASGLNSGLAATEIRDGKFDVHAISGDNPRQPFYWEVKAVRADIDPLEVERAKA
jgi:hypothetical protein